jgi:excisionase family DNA binding protein
MQRDTSRQHDQGSTDPRRFMDTKQTADYLGISASTLTKWRMYGRGPRYFNFGSLVRYSVDDVNAYVESARSASPSTAA